MEAMEIKDISNNFSKRELDVLLSSGEQVTSSLLAGALIESGIKSKSWLNWQIPILTEGEHTNSRIINMNVKEINNFLSAYSSISLVVPILKLFVTIAKTKFKKKNKPKNINIAKYKKVSVCVF